MKEKTSASLKEQLEKIIESETQLFSHEATLGSGKGGQKVNKTSSTIQTTYDFTASSILTEKQKEKVIAYLSTSATYRSKDMKLKVKTQEGREQLKNKQWWIRKIKELLYEILYEQPPRNLSASELKKLKNQKTESLSDAQKQRLSSFKKMQNKKRAAKKKRKITKMRQSQKKKSRGKKGFEG